MLTDPRQFLYGNWNLGVVLLQLGDKDGGKSQSGSKCDHQQIFRADCAELWKCLAKFRYWMILRGAI